MQNLERETESNAPLSFGFTSALNVNLILLNLIRSRCEQCSTSDPFSKSRVHILRLIRKHSSLSPPLQAPMPLLLLCADFAFPDEIEGDSVATMSNIDMVTEILHRAVKFYGEDADFEKILLAPVKPLSSFVNSGSANIREQLKLRILPSEQVTHFRTC
jgi:hypothetical protein